MIDLNKRYTVMKLATNSRLSLLQKLILALTFLMLPTILCAQNIDALVENCIACHGEKGLSNNDIWPNLAGQQRNYLANQIIAFRDKNRDAPTMWPFVKDLSDKEIAAIADHYSAMQPAAPSGDEVDSDGQNVRAYCISCHGLSGNTVVSEWPNLAGQKKGYLIQQLNAYKSGERQHPIMHVIANELSEKNISDVAKYYSQIGTEPTE